ECEHGRLHQWPEIGWIEAPDQESRDLVCTGLLNEDMPLIRYRVGDSGSLPRVVEPCSCGRGLPQLSAIAGRTNDLFLTRDGRRVFWLNPVLYGIPVREAQLVQETLDRVRVRYVPAAGFTSAAG